MKLTIALLLAGLLLLGVGGEAFYHVATNQQQTALTCDELTLQPPRASWLKLSGCQLGEVHHTEAGGQITELLFPVRRSGQTESDPALMVAVTRNPEALAVAQDTIGQGQQPAEEARTVMTLRLLTLLDAAPQIQGYVRRSLLETFGRRRSAPAIGVPLVPGAAVLELNERPGVVLPAALTGAGLALLLIGLARLVRREAAAPAADAVPPQVTDVVPPREGVRLNGLMLLNLSPSAGREAIEVAPPLGPREEVEQSITRALDGIVFDERGRGTLTSEDVSLNIELGPEPVAWTAILNGQGRGARDLVRALVAETGWRIYYPKRGAFVEVEDLELL
jgi:hypothetical protein